MDTMCGLLASRPANTTGSQRLGSVAGPEKHQTPSLGAAWQYVLGSEMNALYTLIEDLNGLASEFICFLTSRYS
jgi:hypothetical protein